MSKLWPALAKLHALLCVSSNMKNIRKCNINTGPIYADLLTFHGLQVGATVGGLTESGNQSPKINYLLRYLFYFREKITEFLL